MKLIISYLPLINHVTTKFEWLSYVNMKRDLVEKLDSILAFSKSL